MYGKDVIVRMFRNHCFGDWLDVPYIDQEPNLVHGMLLRQEEVNEDIHNQSHMLRFNVGDYYCNFGRVEFCLMTGLKFGVFDLKDFENAPTPIVERLFPRLQSAVTLLDLLKLFEGPDFLNLEEQDAIRLCLVIFVEFILYGREPRHEVQTFLFALVEDLDAFDDFPWGSYCWVPTYESLRNAAWHHIPKHLKINDSKVNKLRKSKKKVLREDEETDEGNGDEKTDDEKLNKYTLYGFIWGFKVCFFNCFPSYFSISTYIYLIILIFF